jgi:hypothetical protein
MLTTETLSTTEKTEFSKLFSVPSAVLSVSVVEIRSLAINALQLDFLGRINSGKMTTRWRADGGSWIVDRGLAISDLRSSISSSPPPQQGEQAETA